MPRRPEHSLPILFVGGSSDVGRKWVKDWRDYSGSPVPAMLLPRGSIDVLFFFTVCEQRKYFR